MNNPGIGPGAIFSEDKAYRFALWRRWDMTQPVAMCIGLNPSTANDRSDDPTIRRLSGPWGLMGRNGFGGFYMMNLFPFVTPYPEELEGNRFCLAQNDEYLQKVNLYCVTVIFCWGNFNTLGRDKEIMAMFPAAECFGKNHSGSPKHPLYLHSETKLKAF